MDAKEWKALLTFRDKFYLRIFTMLGLCSPSIKFYNRSQVVHLIEATDFRAYEIEEGNGEIQIKLVR